MEQWTIGEVARRVGLRPSALRYYENVGLLPAPERNSGRRLYDATILPRLAMIQMARQAGFSIAEIQSLFPIEVAPTPPAQRWRTLATHKVAALDAQILQAQQMKALLLRGADCPCERYETCELLAIGD